VVSLLAQTHHDVAVVVVNDGDPEPPWDVLSDIQDRRLVRFSLTANRGPYFATDVVLKAATTPYFLIQDADDWSDPRRLEFLLNALEREHSDLAVSAAPQFVETREGNRVVDIRWRIATHKANAGNFIVHHSITSAFKYRAPHHGLFRCSSLRAIGGYYAGLKISYDTLLPNLILMLGKISHVPQCLYYRMLRMDSLTHGRQTRSGSENATREAMLQRELYGLCFAQYRRFVGGGISAAELAASIRAICGARVTSAEQMALSFESRRLSALLAKAGR
jgi:glycosyltransferase involved in cell wall biosynthesis